MIDIKDELVIILPREDVFFLISLLRCKTVNIDRSMQSNSGRIQTITKITTLLESTLNDHGVDDGNGPYEVSSFFSDLVTNAFNKQTKG